MIPYGRQSIDEDDIAAVVEVLRSDWLTQGPKIEEFEGQLCELTGARHAVALSSGTAALHAAAHAAGLGPGAHGYTSALSFVASANALRYVGAEVDFIDIDPSTLNLDTASIPENADALVAVHYAGLPVDLRYLNRRPRVVIEDAAHAIGATTPDGPVGNCSHSDMCCFSFHPVKTVTTGEGGAVTTNSDDLAGLLREFRHHGVRRAPGGHIWEYDVVSLGFNYRITDIQAALGVSQLGKLGQYVERRQQLAEQYRRALAHRSEIVLPPAPSDGFTHAYHIFPIRVPDRDRVVSELRSRGIGVQVHYVPTYRFTSFSPQPSSVLEYPNTELAYEGLVSLPLYPALSDANQDLVIRELLEVL